METLIRSLMGALRQVPNGALRQVQNGDPQIGPKWEPIDRSQMGSYRQVPNRDPQIDSKWGPLNSFPMGTLRQVQNGDPQIGSKWGPLNRFQIGTLRQVPIGLSDRFQMGTLYFWFKMDFWSHVCKRNKIKINIIFIYSLYYRTQLGLFHSQYTYVCLQSLLLL